MKNISPKVAWDEFLSFPAISYPVPRHPTPHTENQPIDCSHGCYWNSELLDKWKDCYRVDNDASSKEEGVSSVNYGSLLLLASHASSILRQKLSLNLTEKRNVVDAINHEDYNIRIGLAIPEGPFLPLFVLVVHALNVALGDGFFHEGEPRDQGNETHSRCNGVVLVPMETEEAPERLRHILADSNPNIILVAPGRDTESLITILGSNPCPIQLVDYTLLVREALAWMDKHAESGDMILKKLYPSSIQDAMIDSLRYPHAIPGNYWDVARLVAWGSRQLGAIMEDNNHEYNFPASIKEMSDVSHRCIMSHIVYTSGTTGELLFQ